MEIPPRKKLKSEHQKDMIEKNEILQSIHMRLQTNQYQAFVKIFQYVLENFNKLSIKRVAGIDFLCLHATHTLIHKILQSPDKAEFELGSDDNPISPKSVYHDKSASLGEDGAIKKYGNMYNFHYDDDITPFTNGIAICWASCLSVSDLEACGTAVAKGKKTLVDNRSRIKIDEDTGLVYLRDDDAEPDLQPLPTGNLPLDHIIITNFGKQLHSPPPSNYLQHKVLYRLFLSIELNPKNRTVQEFNANVTNLASNLKLTLNI